MNGPPANRQIVLAVLLVAVGVGLGAGGGYAGDDVTVVEFDPQRPAVEPGETVEVDVTVASEGAHGDTGLYSVALRLDYPAEHASVAAVEGGSWFQQADREVDVRETVRTDDDAGVAVVEQELSEPESGVTGDARFATVTFAVDSDAPAGTVVVAASETTAMLTSRYPQPVTARQAELRVAGGGDRIEPEIDEGFAFTSTTAETGATVETGSTAATTDAENERSGAAAETTTTDSEGDASALGGVAVVAILLAVLLRCGSNE